MSHFFKTFSKILGFLSAIFVFAILIILLKTLINPLIKQSLFSYYSGNPDASKKLAIINITGPIISENQGLLNFKSINAIYPSLVEKYLIDLKKQKISGLIISINSPGGSVSASNKIYNLFNKFKIENNIPIYFYSTDMLASGAYWISLSGDKIYANYGAIIGSIGVKGPDWIYYNTPNSISSGIFGNSVESKKGIELFSNTAGKSKDILNPFRPPTVEEIEQLQNMVDEIYIDFINIVSKNRKIEKNTIQKEIGAMIYNTQTATKNYLIDGEKNIDEIIELMKNQLDIKDFKIITNNKNKNTFTNLNIINDYFNNNEVKIKKIYCNNFKNELSVILISSFDKSC